MARRQFSDSDKASALAALDANGGNVKGTARDLGIAEATLRSWAKDRGTGPGVADLRDHKKADLAQRLQSFAEKVLAAMPDKIEAASLAQCATSLGIAIDKMLRLREVTEIDDDEDGLTDDDIASELA